MWAADPLDKLNHSLQYADAHDKSLRDAADPNGPLTQCQKAYYEMVSSSATSELPASSLAFHFGGEGSTVHPHDALMSAVGKAMRLSSGVWCSCCRTVRGQGRGF